MKRFHIWSDASREGECIAAHQPLDGGLLAKITLKSEGGEVQHKTMAEITLKNYDLELCRHLKYTHLINSIYNRSLGIMINKLSITLYLPSSWFKMLLD